MNVAVLFIAIPFATLAYMHWHNIKQTGRRGLQNNQMGVPQRYVETDHAQVMVYGANSNNRYGYRNNSNL